MQEKAEACPPCRIAASIGITKNICDEFQLSCSELDAMLEKPEAYSLLDAVKAVKKIASSTTGEPKHLLDYTICVMEGECQSP